MQNLLDQQQRLALQDKKLLEEYKEEIREIRTIYVVDTIDMILNYTLKKFKSPKYLGIPLLKLN